MEWWLCGLAQASSVQVWKEIWPYEVGAKPTGSFGCCRSSLPSSTQSHPTEEPGSQDPGIPPNLTPPGSQVSGTEELWSVPEWQAFFLLGEWGHLCSPPSELWLRSEQAFKQWFSTFLMP